jgi:hypothetical protein
MATLSASQLSSGYQAATASVRARVLAYSSSLWLGSSGFRDTDVERLISRIIPTVRAGQVQVANITDSYISRMAALSGVNSTSGVDVASITGYRGVDSETVYRRPAVAVYSALSKGETFAAASAFGLQRLTSIVETDVQQAKNRQASRSISGSGFSGFRRALTGPKSCAFCVIASTQRYSSGDLMPLHPGCGCSVLPLTGSAKNQVLDPGLLKSTHDSIDAKMGADYTSDKGARNLGQGKLGSKGEPISDFTDLIVTNNHGELGPTLGWRGDNFTGPNDLN